MKTQLGACRRAVPSSNSEALWITNDVLAAAFNRFARRHVRHQSHVPGPLESQKRAARRKKTVLAYSQPPALHPAILFPDKPQSGWWNSQPAQEHEAPKSILPAWLRGSEDATKHGTSTQSESTLDFEGDLACCHSPADLRALVRDHELNLRVDTAQTEALYEHVDSKDWPTPYVAEYLADPVLNPLGCRNHLRILRNFARDISDRDLEDSRRYEDWSHMLQGICKAVRLGLLSADEWMQAVDTALAISAKIDGCETYRNSEGLSTLSSASVTLALLESLKMCPVIDRKYISFTWLETLPARAMANGFIPRIVRLLKVVGLKRNVPVIVELLKMSLQRPDIETRSELLSTAEAISQLTHATLLKVLGQMTATLTEEIIAGNMPPTILVSWMRVLRTINGEVNGDLKYRVRLADHDVHFLTPMTGRFQSYGPDTAALVLWTVHQLCDPTAIDAGFEPPDCLSVLRRVISSEEVQTVRSLHTTVLDAIEPLPLPDKESLIPRLPTFLRRYTGYRESDLQATFAKFIAGDLAQITHTATYCYMRDKHPQALRDAMQRVNNDLPGFRRLVRHTIATNKLLFKVIIRIMRHNMRFRDALKRSWSTTDPGFGIRSDGTRAWVNAAPLDHRKPVAREAEPADKFRAGNAAYVDPAEALDTLHFIAINFAVSQAVPARTALTKVYWCYKLLVRSRAPVHAAISRALWHAGFERGGHCGPMRLMWLLRKVREIEGPEVALELLRNPEFRRKRKEGFERVARWKNGEEFGGEKGHLLREVQQLQNEETEWKKEYSCMEGTVKEVMAWEADARLQKYQAFVALPEQPSMEEFDRWLASRAEAIDNEEDEHDELYEPLWLWNQDPTRDQEPEAAFVAKTWKPVAPNAAASAEAVRMKKPEATPTVTWKPSLPPPVAVRDTATNVRAGRVITAPGAGPYDDIGSVCIWTDTKKPIVSTRERGATDGKDVPSASGSEVQAVAPVRRSRNKGQAKKSHVEVK